MQVVARWAMKTGIAHPNRARASKAAKTRISKKHPSDKGTPTARSVRKAEGLELETAKAAEEGEVEHTLFRPTPLSKETPPV
jgi:hypothetical protein